MAAYAAAVSPASAAGRTTVSRAFFQASKSDANVFIAFVCSSPAPPWSARYAATASCTAASEIVISSATPARSFADVAAT